MFTERLINELGLLKLQPKILYNQTDQIAGTTSETTLQEIQKTPPMKSDMVVVKLDKNEFRLLVKMLQAIKHECVYDLIGYDGKTVSYQHPKKTLVFKDIKLADTHQTMNLSSLSDLITNSALKRPNWEKLKTL